ncbi:MAG: dienelactone hydrolase family protein [Aphanocapsa lilacina HA4352-LM1]|nr:dienelactone hydrolase family protein [Aphanocapsa lilacina HA4352-LM1]
MAERITIESKDGSFGAYVARPSARLGPGLVIIQEIFGINATMRAIADAFAQAGYIAVVPDLFWRLEPGVELVDQGSDLEKAFGLYNAYDEDRGVTDLIAALVSVRQLEGCTGTVGTVGYCLGGKLAYLMATRSNADANVSYYGVGIERNLEEVGNISRPLLLHIAEKDELVAPAARGRILDAVAQNPLITTHLYPGMGHAFARVDGTTYQIEAAELANGRSLSFLSSHLG